MISDHLLLQVPSHHPGAATLHFRRSDFCKHQVSPGCCSLLERSACPFVLLALSWRRSLHSNPALCGPVPGRLPSVVRSGKHVRRSASSASAALASDNLLVFCGCRCAENTTRQGTAMSTSLASATRATPRCTASATTRVCWWRVGRPVHMVLWMHLAVEAFA